jgi:hypothetical protein
MHDITNHKEKSVNAVYRTIDYSGSSSGTTATTTTRRITTRVNKTQPPNYNENDALNRAIQDSQQEHLLRTTATSTGLSLNQLR